MNDLRRTWAEYARKKWGNAVADRALASIEPDSEPTPAVEPLCSGGSIRARRKS
jgi:hypothetical protein